jgi:hypothetical protein
MGDRVRGIGYDAGVLYEKSFDSNPGFTEQRARRDFRAIREELGCDAVLIMATDPERLGVAARCAVDEGLAVWLQPRPFDRPARPRPQSKCNGNFPEKQSRPSRSSRRTAEPERARSRSRVLCGAIRPRLRSR